jgi:Na+/melibiose symporter-like transporter
MAQETKVVKGGFRATLALIISIIALILAIIAYQSTGKEETLNERVKDLQTKIETMKQETSKKLDTLRNETADTLGKIGKSMKKEEGQEENKQ